MLAIWETESYFVKYNINSKINSDISDCAIKESLAFNNIEIKQDKINIEHIFSFDNIGVVQIKPIDIEIEIEDNYQFFKSVDLDIVAGGSSYEEGLSEFKEIMIDHYLELYHTPEKELHQSAKLILSKYKKYFKNSEA